jgi:predicted nucleotide-binding protein
MAFPEELWTVVQNLSAAAPPGFEAQLDAVAAAAERFADAWSGSNVADHAQFYRVDFSSAGGLSFRDCIDSGIGQSSWQNYSRAEVRAAIMRESGDVDFEAKLRFAAKLRKSVDDAKWDLDSILSGLNDSHLAKILRVVGRIEAPTSADLIDRYLEGRERPFATDIRWAGRPLRIAPHEEVLCEVEAIRGVLRAANEVAEMAGRASDHLAVAAVSAAGRSPGTHVFIGHGRSAVWRDLKDFLVERLGLKYDEFNRVPIAGTTNISRLSEMLDNAAFAFLILTAEDERADGSVVARQNVIHEAGLFQGRLGFSRAILMIEEGCESFSNVDGLGQIRFPPGDLRRVLDEVRHVLEREGVLTGPG